MRWKLCFCFGPVLAALVLLNGCGALSAVTTAAEPLDAFTLSPLTHTDHSRSGLHLVVEVPTASGAIGTDRILFKPGPLQAQYLPDGQWVEPAPVLMQTLMVDSLQNTGPFLRVGRDGAGLLPDYTLITELTDFQAEEGTPQIARVGMSVTLIRESDRGIVMTRRFETTAPASAPSTAGLIAAFASAASEMLQEVVAWTSAMTDR